ncbi:hypothetical protein [Streptomyces sp. NPDC057002]
MPGGNPEAWCCWSAQQPPLTVVDEEPDAAGVLLTGWSHSRAKALGRR